MFRHFYLSNNMSIHDTFFSVLMQILQAIAKFDLDNIASYAMITIYIHDGITLTVVSISDRANHIF